MENRLKNSYFNYAGLAPTTESCRTKCQEAEEEFKSILFSEEGVNKYLELLVECRNALRELIHAPSSDGIVILPNASFGLNIALNGLEPKTGQVIVTSDQEHPAVEIPLNLFSRRRVEIRRVSGTTPEEIAEEVERLLKQGRVALIVMSHVSYKDGRILPVEKIGNIAREHSIPYVVDGAQAVGQVEVDLSRIQPWVYVFSGHKWLFGPMGTGGMWVDKKFLERSGGVWASWAAKSERLNGSRFEGGTANFGLIAGFLQAIVDTLRHKERRRISLLERRDEIIDRLSRLTSWTLAEWKGEHAPGILTYVLPDRISAWEIAHRMDRDHGVTVKPFTPPEKPNAIRISFSPWTSDEEIVKLTTGLTQEMRSVEVSHHREKYL